MTLGDLATWVGAVATVGLLIGAIVTSYFAIKAFHTQRDELTLLKNQYERDTDRRRRAQAAKVLVDPQQKQKKEVTGTYKTISTATVHNTSREAIYSLRASWYKEEKEETTQLAEHVGPNLMPNGSFEFEHDAHVAGVWAVVCFRDAAGIRWQRASDGTLQEVKSS